MKSILLLFLTMGCASSLKSASEIGEAPEKMRQKIEKIPDQAVVNSPKITPVDNKLNSEVSASSASSSLSSASTSLAAAKRVHHSKGKMLGPKSVSPAVPVEQPHKQQDGFVNEWPYSLGEKLTYVIRYGPIEGGLATIEVAPIEKIEGEPALHYIAHARSHKFFDLFYKVDDIYETWTRLKDHLPIRQEITQNESGEWGKRVVIFDQKKREQHFYSSTTRPNRPTKIIDERHELFNNPQDMLSAFYFARFVKDPKKITFPVHDRFKHWNNEYTFDGKEEIKTKAGTFMCNRYRVYPRVQGNLEPQGDALLWLTDDDRKIMTKFNVKIKIGSITGDLTAYQAGQPWHVPLPNFATPLNLDPSQIVNNKEQK